MQSPDVRLVTEAKLTNKIPGIVTAATSAAAVNAAATYVAFRGDWVADIIYPKNTLILYNSALYLAPSDVPARPAFITADWISLAGTGQ